MNASNNFKSKDLSDPYSFMEKLLYLIHVHCIIKCDIVVLKEITHSRAYCLLVYYCSVISYSYCVVFSFLKCFCWSWNQIIFFPLLNYYWMETWIVNKQCFFFYFSCFSKLSAESECEYMWDWLILLMRVPVHGKQEMNI